MIEGLTMGDILQFGAMGLLCLVLYMGYGGIQKQLEAKDIQITMLTNALIETKLNAKALDIVTAQLAAVMPMAAAGFQAYSTNLIQPIHPPSTESAPTKTT